MNSIDSDAHVIEIPYTWEFMDEAEKKRGKEMGDDVLTGNNIYVACQVTDDLPMSSTAPAKTIYIRTNVRLDPPCI